MSKPRLSQARQLSARILGFNLSPKGAVESIMIEGASGIAQINLEKGADLPAEWTEGATVDVRVRDEDGRGDHPVYSLVDGDQAVSGRVARFNHTRHGEVNGFVLEDGTFVHLKPDGAKRFAAKVGDQVSAEGSLHVGPHARVVESTRAVHLAPTRAKRKSA